MLFCFLLVMGLFFCDQLTKLFVEMLIDKNDHITLIPDFLYFTKTYNTGAAWSMLENNTPFLALLSFIATIGLVYLLTKYDWKRKKIYTISMCMCVSGCFGNFVDRFMYSIGYGNGVIDFIGVYIFNYTFPIFNVADICLVVGMILLAIDIIFLDDLRKKSENSN